MNDFVPRYHATRLSHQFLLLVAATAKLSLVKHCIIDKYQKLYPQEPYVYFCGTELKGAYSPRSFLTFSP